MKYLFMITAVTIDEEGKKNTSYNDVVASNVVKAIEYLVNEKGIDVNTIDYASRKSEVPVVD